MRVELSPDELLATTRTVRRRLDFSRPVERDVIVECLELALQAPTRSNSQSWHFVIVTDPDTRLAIGELYRRAFAEYAREPFAAGNLFADDPVRASQQRRVMDAAAYLAERMHEAPVLLIPCMTPRIEDEPRWKWASYWGSILPAAWSFVLAARTRGLGAAWCTLHLRYEREMAEIVGIPHERATQAALMPVAYTKGTDFRPAERQPLETAVHWDRW